MVDLSVGDGRVRFTLLGRDRIYAVKRKVNVPVGHIAGVRRAGDRVSRPRGLRLAGTALPGVIYAGSFWAPGGWSFWDVRVRHAGNVIVVDLKDDFYRQLVVEVADPAAAVAAIEGAMVR
ncbi:MAG: hypothetical protein IVW36_10665 [Dehalococcoidia bacterium]|nr:hypothetical protein [Dehalococcoidia bacterium]